MKIVQVQLKSDNGETLVTWLDSRKGLKEGVYVTLKDFKPDTKWEVVNLYPGEHESSEFDWHRKWDNNI